MWDRPTLETSIENLVFDRILGKYTPEDCLSIYLDVEYLKKEGIYAEVEAHEWTHLHLVTSTTIGHALMFLANSRLRFLGGFKSLYEGLMLASREIHEGVATLAEWEMTQATRPSLPIEKFRKELPPDYLNAFDICNSAAQILLPPECYWMKNLVANALAQFALNTDIMPHLMPLVAQDQMVKGAKDMQGFLNSDHGHPQRRVHRAMSELGEPSSQCRTLRCNQIVERLRQTASLIKSKFPKLCDGRHYQVLETNRESRMLVNDEINQTFLRFFVDITGLPVSAYHARDAGKQWDALAGVFEKKVGIKLFRYDMTDDIRRRASFKPIVQMLW